MSSTDPPRDPARRMRRGLLVGAALLLASLAAAAWATGAFRSPARFHGTAYVPPEPAADFRLTDHAGRQTSLADFRGTAVLLFFGFTHCPDVCPLTLAKLSRVLDSMDADTADVRVLLVTVDPSRDTPAVLAEYVGRFGPHVVGLTGDSATLARVRDEYAAFAQHYTDPDGHHQVRHTTAVFGIDRAGRIRVLLPVERPDEVLAEDVETLLSL